MRKLAAALLLGLLACGGLEPIADADLPALLDDLGSDDPARIEAAATRIEAHEDVRFIAPLIELLRASQLGTHAQTGYDRRVVALERLSGELLGADWLGWTRWYADQDIPLIPGFTSFKGALYAAFDPGYAGLLSDDPPPRIRIEAIQWRGTQLDDAAALDDPRVETADQADWLEPGEPVAGIEIDGLARAYPMRILDWHEIVNDTLADRSISLFHAPLYGAVRAFDARFEGEVRRFSSAGLLYESNTLVFDRGTRSVWLKLSGQPVMGELSRHAEGLTPLPVVISTWDEWRLRHPESTVVSIATGHDRVYRGGNPYGGYYQSPLLLFPIRTLRPDFSHKERVFGLRIDGFSKAWPLSQLVGAGVLNDAIGKEGVVLVANEGRIEVEGDSELAGAVRYDAGGAVRAYATGQIERPEFDRGPDERSLVDGDGGVWRITEVALIGPDGRTFPRLPGVLAYWFGWQSVHPDTLVYAP